MADETSTTAEGLGEDWTSDSFERTFDPYA